MHKSKSGGIREGSEVSCGGWHPPHQPVRYDKAFKRYAVEHWKRPANGARNTLKSCPSNPANHKLDDDIASGMKSTVLLAIVFVCLFWVAWQQYNDGAQEWTEVLLRLQWMALGCLGLWCAAFLWLSWRRVDWFLVLVMSLAVARLRFGETSRPTGVLVLLFSVMLGKGACWTLRFGSANEEKTFVAGLVWLLAFASWWHLDIAYTYYHGPRWMGPWDNPNTYGVLMGAGVSLGIGQFTLKAKGTGLKAGAETVWQLRKGGWQPVLLFVATGMMAVGLLFSYSRGAWLGTTAGLLYLAKSYGKLKWRWVLPGISVVAAMVCVFWHSTPDAGPWYLKRLDFSRPSAQHRVAAWNAAIHIICDHPLGVGWGRAVNVYEEKYSPPEGGAGAITTNDYLMLASELGLPGLLCFVTYVGLCFQAGRFAPRALSSPGKPTSPFIPHSSLQAACRSAALSMAVAFWFDGGLFKLPTAAVFWILLEMGTAAGNGEQKSHQATKPQLLTG